MAAFSYNERFIPMLLDGSKGQTIRGRRRSMPKIGDTMHQYYAQRSRNSRKLREDICTNIRSITITVNGIHLFQDVVPWEDLQQVIRVPFHRIMGHGRHILSDEEVNRFAWADGFRPEGTTAEDPGDAWELMYRFWCRTHSLHHFQVWCGDVYYWNPADGKCIAKWK